MQYNVIVKTTGKVIVECLSYDDAAFEYEMLERLDTQAGDFIEGYYEIVEKV